MNPASVDTYELGALLIYATRYAIGRQTYAVSDVCASLRKHWGSIRDADKVTLRRDIGEELMRRADVGNKMADCDAREWRSVLELP